jgi:serine/threonine protein kinase
VKSHHGTQVRHENIIGLICTYIAPAKVFIVTELASGGELLERCVKLVSRTRGSRIFGLFFILLLPELRRMAASQNQMRAP